MFDSNAREHAHELVAADASDRVVGTQAGSQGVGHRDEKRVAGCMTSGVVGGFEPVDVHIRSHELSTVALSAVDLAPYGRQAGAAAADSSQLVGPGILTVLGSLRAIFRRNLAVVAALCAIVGCNPAVVDRSHAAVCGLGLPPPYRRQLVGPGIFAVFRGVCAIFSRNLAVIDSSHAAVGSLSTSRVGPGAFVGRALTVARRAIACSSVAISGGVVPRFGLSIT